MQIKFDGQTHSIDANTLITVLTNYQNVIAKVNMEYGGGAREIQLRVNALEKGSFVIDVELVQNIVERIFSKDTIGYIASLVTIVGAVFGVYKHFKGKPTEKGTTIKDCFNDNTYIKYEKTIVNIYNDKSVRSAISKSIEAADADVSVDSVSFDADKGGVTDFSRSDFKDYIYTDFDKEDAPQKEKDEEKEATLIITALSFESGSMWKFMYDGFRISSIVKDDALMKKIDEGARFGKGDAIRVKLKIHKRYNEEYRAYENTSYKIVEFYEHIEAPKQGELF